MEHLYQARILLVDDNTDILDMLKYSDPSRFSLDTDSF